MPVVTTKIQKGFQGEKMISIPPFAIARNLRNMPPGLPHITHIGYFPKARYHYRERKNGCEDDILFYCVNGKGYYMVDGVRYELPANHFVVIPATTKSISYWADRDEPWSIFWVHFRGSRLEEFNRVLEIGKELDATYIPFNREGIGVWEKMYNCLSRGYTLDNMVNANMCLPHLLATFFYSHKHQSQAAENTDTRDYISEVIKHMEENVDKKITVEELSALTDFSASHFSKLFRISTGMPPMDYFIHLKMLKACHLLCTSDMKVKKIALLLGYEDSYYFSRLFKKSNKLSPKEYRASIKKVF